MLRILVANQISIVRIGLRDIINKEADFTFVGSAENGHAARDQCLQFQPHVIIVTSSLPGPSTSSLANVLGANCPRVNILVLTNTVGEVNVQDLIRNGVSGCILQEEPDVLFAQAIRSVGLGAAWFSKGFVANLAQQHPIAPQEFASRHNLTKRELEVVSLVADGFRNRQIATFLSVKERTVEFHMTNIFQKLNVDSRIEVSNWARDSLDRSI